MAYTQRIRKTDTQVATKLYTNWRNNPEPYEHYFNALTGGFTGSLDSIEDSTTPTYVADTGVERVILNPVKIRKYKRTVTEGSMTEGPYAYWGGFSSTTRGDFARLVEQAVVLNGSIPQGIIDLMLSRALTKAYAKVNDNTLLTGEFIRDLSTTLSMFRRPFQSSTKLLGKMKTYRSKRVGKTAVSATKASLHAWLEYRYGWRPVIGDMIKIMTQAADRASTINPLLVSRASEVTTNTLSQTFVDQPIQFDPTGFGLAKASGSVSGSHSVGAHAGVIYTVKEDSAQASLKYLGLRSKDLLATAWEIMPYSFVVDWFLNIGTWLEAVTPNPQVAIAGNWVTLVSKHHATYAATLSHRVDTPTVVTLTGSGGGSTVYTDDIVRSINLSLPTTPLPKLDFLQWEQTVDAIGLAAGKVFSSLKGYKH